MRRIAGSAPEGYGVFVVARLARLVACQAQDRAKREPFSACVSELPLRARPGQVIPSWNQPAQPVAPSHQVL